VNKLRVSGKIIKAITLAYRIFRAAIPSRTMLFMDYIVALLRPVSPPASIQSRSWEPSIRG
jgi:hypothetical protein